MKKYLLPFAAFFCALIFSEAECALPPEFSVQLRSRLTLAASSNWLLAGAPLFVEFEGELNAFVPLRRRISGTAREGGNIRKISYSLGGAPRTLWNSSVSAPRMTLLTPWGEELPHQGLLQLAPPFSKKLGDFFGLDLSGWNTLLADCAASSMAAPWPAAMVLVESTLYCQCDDGRLCALDAATGRELWSFFPPQICRASRLRTALKTPDGEPLPWLLAGGLTVEKTGTVQGTGRLLLFGSLGQGGRGLYCLDVSDPENPVFQWAREDWPDDSACVLWGSGGVSPSALGFVRAAPLAANYEGKLNLIVPSGAGTAGEILIIDALTGKTLASCAGLEGGGEFDLRPCGLLDSSGALARLIQCDSLGGVNIFSRTNSSWRADSRVNLLQISESESLDFLFEPIPCPLLRGLWLAFVASVPDGTVVAAAPSALSSGFLWTRAPQNLSGEPWWQMLDGFSQVSSALFYDGALYLMGMEKGQSVLKEFDLLSGKLLASKVIDDKIKFLTVYGGSLTGVQSDVATGEISLTSLAREGRASLSSLYYTICR